MLHCTMIRILIFFLFEKQITEGELNQSTSCQTQEETADGGSDSKDVQSKGKELDISILEIVSFFY